MKNEKKTVGLSRSNESKSLYLNGDTRTARLIQRHLEFIRMIFEDADQLCSKYGVTKMCPREPREPTSESALMSFKSQLSVRRYVRWFQKQGSYKLKGKWAIHDQNKFKIMLDDLSTLLQQLRKITSAIADIERQRDRFVEEINSHNRIEDLEIIEEALSEEDPAFSSTASERRVALTEAAMTIQDDGRRQDENDDIMTHADSDPAAQAIFDLNESPQTNGEPQDYRLEEAFPVGADTGNQNNLAKIQQENLRQISALANIRTRYLQFNPGSLGRGTANRVRMELLSFRNDASMSSFISLRLEGNRLVRQAQFSRIYN